MSIFTLKDSGTIISAPSPITLGSGFGSWESDEINLFGANKSGVLTIEILTDTAAGSPTFKLKHSLSGIEYDFLRDSSQNDIEVTIQDGSCTIANIVNCFSGFIKIVGATEGSGDIVSIKILGV